MYDIERIEREMAKQFLSPEQLARRAGVASATVHRVFRTGAGQPETIGKLVVALNLDPNEVVVIKERVTLPPSEGQEVSNSETKAEEPTEEPVSQAS